jgi:hypothetical protein
VHRCVHIPIPGLINSSTRSEAHGLLAGLCAKGPVHLGIDSKAVVDRAHLLLSIATSLCSQRDDEQYLRNHPGAAFEVARKLRKPERLHWQMQRDGDIWQAIWRAALAKGPTSIRITKVKGHATDADVQEGRATAEQKAGNDTADTLVKEATDLHGKGTVDLAYWIEARHGKYKQMMADIQHFIITMLNADQEARERRRKEADPFDNKKLPKVLIPIKLHYSIDAGCRHLNIRSQPAGHHKFAHNEMAVTYVHRFLRFINVRPTYADEPGVTWLELLIAFEAHGGMLQLPINERAAADMARPSMTTMQLLDLFQKVGPLHT